MGVSATSLARLALCACIALCTSLGLVLMDPFSFVVMPGDDDVVMLGNLTLKALGIDVYDSLGARAHECAGLAGVEAAAYKQCHRVSFSVEALQHADTRDEEPADEAVEGLASRGPGVCMSPDVEAAARAEALENAVSKASDAGLGECIIHARWNVFRRDLRPGDLPANVEPPKVTLKPDACPVKVRPRAYNPVLSAWMAACMATLVALGLVFVNMQAVWASAAMMGHKQNSRGCMVGDFRAVNKQVEKKGL